MAHYELGVIGAGNMAEAILHGVIRGKFLPPSAVVAADVSAARREKLARDLGIACVEDNALAAASRRVLLAVKPQVMAAVLEQAAPHVQADAVVISIAAGVTTQFLDEKLHHRGRLIRVMPNTPMLAGAGMSALTAGPRATARDMQWATRLFAASGQTVVVEESMMDAVTAVSGSGPAYFFYLIEALIEAGAAEGLSHDVATTLAVATCSGAARLLAESREAPEVLRARVTSPNGTTQRAIETMEAAGVKAALVKAVRAAAARSRELGQ